MRENYFFTIQNKGKVCIIKLRKEEDMRRLWLLTLLLVSCGSTSSVSGYKEYTNVGYYYNNDLTYTIECEQKEYTLDIDNVYYTKKHDARINNKFYIGVDKKLVIYVEM